MTNEEQSAVNTLLSFLRASNVVNLVEAYYEKYDNKAPSSLLKSQIDKVQELLDKERKCEVQEIDMGPTWKVLKRGDEVSIVDSEGRERHRSKGQINTAMHLAMQLNKQKFVSEPNADEALRLMAKDFEK